MGLGVPPGSSNTATVQAGASATYTLSVGGTGMGGTASLSCAGAPLGATCSVPPSVSISATSASTFNVHVSTTLRATALLLQGGFIFATWLSVAVIGWISLPRRGCRRSASHGWLHLLPLIVLSVLFCSCGGGGSGSGNKADGTPAGSYTLVVTAQSGSVTQSTNLTLTVQ